MNAEILSVGTELLLGQIVNSDAQYLSQQLSAMGINVYFHTTVGDNTERLKQCLQLALSRSDIIITTGGLGPTMDDLTKETIAAYFKMDLVPHTESLARLKNFFHSIGRDMTENNLKQIMFPKDAIVLRNEKGTAPGCIFELDTKIIIILPGPPNELIPMFETSVKPYLAAQSNDIIFSKVLRIFGVGESKVEDEIKDLIRAQTNPTIAPYAGYGEVTLRLTAKCEKHEDPDKIIAPIEKEIKRRFGNRVYGYNSDTLESVAGKLLIENKLKVATAESCTGGMIASKLVSVPGISESFIDGIVCYSNESKLKRIGVSAETIKNHGAVSEETAKEMAFGSLQSTGADIALSVTGIAGPEGGSVEKPVGLVYIGIATSKQIKVSNFLFNGDRERIRMMSCLNALDQLRLELLTH